MPYDNRIEAWFTRRRFTLDIAGLTEFEKEQSSLILGGRNQEFVNKHDAFTYDQIRTVLFKWGDPLAENVFAHMYEFDDKPGECFFPFNAATVLGDMVYSLAVQDKAFNPQRAYRNTKQYFELPFNQEAALFGYNVHQSIPTPRPELIGKVGLHWVAFEIGVDIERTRI